MDPTNFNFLQFLAGENLQSVFDSTFNTSSNPISTSPSSEGFDITPNSLLTITPPTPIYEPNMATSLGVGSTSSSPHQGGTNIASISNLIYSSNSNAPISTYGNFKNADSPRNPSELARESTKRPIDDLSESSDDEGSINSRTSRGKSQKSKKTKVSEEKESNNRAEQQRMASKRYRQKKKMLVEQLEAKLKEVSVEKEKLEKEHKNTIDSLSKLQKENLALKRSSNVESSIEVQELESQLSAYTATLFSILQSRPVNDMNLDKDIIPILDKIKDTFRTMRKKIGDCKAPLLMNTTIVGQLVKMGFFDGGSLGELEFVPESYLQLEHIEDGVLILGGNKKIPQGTNICGIKPFFQKIIEVIPSLSESQKRSMDAIVKRYYSKINVLRVDRDTLNKDLANFISTSGPANQTSVISGSQNTNLNMPMILQAMTSLESTRKSISEEVALAETSIDELMNILTPRQQAELFIEIEDERRKIGQLKKVWDSIRSPQ